MAEIGQDLVNPVTGERFVWQQTAASTGGTFCEFELHLDQGAVVAAAHTHPLQAEAFEVTAGSIRLRIDPETELLVAGDKRMIPAGTAHSWENASSGPTCLLVRLTPALRSEDFFETFCGLARDGKANTKGIAKNPLQLAVLADAYRNEMRLTGPAGSRPARLLISLVAAIGRLAGFQARYPHHAAEGIQPAGAGPS
jgi:quercetin dioxygenase-like cupin family protein